MDVTQRSTPKQIQALAAAIIRLERWREARLLAKEQAKYRHRRKRQAAA